MGVSRETQLSILRELVELARSAPERRLLQFGALASAHQYRNVYESFARYVDAGAEVLDWGAGNGHFSYFLTRIGMRATGFSLRPGDFVAWLADPGYHFVQGSAEEPTRLPFKDESFDAVTSVGVLEHVRETGGNESGSLAELRRVLRPGGVLLCAHFPQHSSWIDAVAARRPGSHWHRFRYRRSQVQQLIADAGFELVQLQRYGFLPRNALGRLPAWLGDSPVFIGLWNTADRLLGALLPFLCQNFLFVARKPRTA